jgi:hypothetical protein
VHRILSLTFHEFTELHREDTKSHRERLHNEAANAIVQQFQVEIEQQANLVSRRPEIGEYLGFVNWSDLLDDLDLYDDLLLHKEINTVTLIQVYFFVGQGKRLLPFKAQSELLQVICQTSLIG